MYPAFHLIESRYGICFISAFVVSTTIYLCTTQYFTSVYLTLLENSKTNVDMRN